MPALAALPRSSVVTQAPTFCSACRTLSCTCSCPGAGDQGCPRSGPSSAACHCWERGAGSRLLTSICRTCSTRRVLATAMATATSSVAPLRSCGQARGLGCCHMRSSRLLCCRASGQGEQRARSGLRPLAAGRRSRTTDRSLTTWYLKHAPCSKCMFLLQTWGKW